MKKYAAIIATSILVAGCTDVAGAEKALAAIGLTDIRAGGYAFFGCGNDDEFHTEFVAKSPGGKVVTGVVCGGWFKGNTVRFN